MSITYNNVLKRLKEERCQLSLSQEEMGQYLHMTQSNYSKIELGLRRLGYYELRYLCKTKLNVHYIFTGIRGNVQYVDILLHYSYSELICDLRIIYALTVLHHGKKMTEQSKTILNRIDYVSLLEERQDSGNIFFVLRRSMNCQQQKMAEKLGVDIKKLRNLENGRCLPDSELLWRLYQLYRIPPWVVLKDKNGLISEISSLLERLDDGEEIFEIIKMVHAMN